jgi:hypothetical protein
MATSDPDAAATRAAATPGEGPIDGYEAYLSAQRTYPANVIPPSFVQNAVLGGLERTDGEKPVQPERPAQTRKSATQAECPRHESNMRTRFRKPLLYPLSYGGVWLNHAISAHGARELYPANV